MIDQPVLRLFRCRPLRTAFDGILREEMIPELRCRPGVIDVQVGRKGPDELGERLVSSVWESREAMVASMGDGLESPHFHPEYLAETTDRSLESLPVATVLRFGGDQEPGIVRLARGEVRPGELPAYVEEARAGALGDIAGGAGPIALYLAIEGPDRFVTLSIWDSWSSIETATGADVRRPIATQRSERLVAFDVTHYEAVRGLVRA
jgi:heme-degrading monooxygenase HmoA